MESTYITSAQLAHQLPQYELPEVAFIGRSNSGKSSLLNALLERKKLARTSSTPGRTQMVNFFSLKMGAGKEMIFADLPGYGYNVAPAKIRKHWDELLAKYMSRSNICDLVMITDARRGFDEYELNYMQELSSTIPLTIALSKIDKLNKSELTNQINDITKELIMSKIAFHKIFAISSLRKTGVLSLREHIFRDSSLQA